MSETEFHPGYVVGVTIKPRPCSPRAASFLDDLRRLCLKYEIQLATSGYDSSIQLWPLDKGESFIYNDMIEDKLQ